VKKNYILAPHTWFQVGGACPLFFKAKTHEDLLSFLKNHSDPIFYLGAGSNLLIRDGGMDESVIKLVGEFNTINCINEIYVIAGAACLDRTLALQAASWGLSGLEFLATIPGTIGGAAYMNAGAYGGEFIDVVEWIEMVMRDGETIVLKKEDLNMSYRKGNLPLGACVTRVCFRCKKDIPHIITDRINVLIRKREESQPVKGRTGGSTFKNPDGHKAWELIDQAGCRGLSVGAAKMSEKHCNFMMNEGGATAAQLEELGKIVKELVVKKQKIVLEWEIYRIGRCYV
jgi:UDP-N-acetylmuramate dehydrogenase